MKQEMMGGSGISWTICKSSAPRTTQITTLAPHHSTFYRPDALPDAEVSSLTHGIMLKCKHNTYLLS